MEQLNYGKGINEKNIFKGVLFLNLLPVFLFKFFPTMDGPAHLYNSNLINNLLFSSGGKINEFFTLNEVLVPNWTGHFVLSFFNLFLPAYLAEKVLLIIYFVGLPYSFRKLIKTINPQNVFISYLIFPFTYSFLFLLGFYNFSLAIIVLFLILSFWLKNENQKTNVQEIFYMFLLLTLAYFSHVFIFITSLFIIGLRIGFLLISKLITSKGETTKEIVLFFAKKTGGLIVSAIIPLLLFLAYFFKGSANVNYTFLDKSELITQFMNLRSLIVYDPNVEQAYTRKLFYLFFIIVVYISLVSIFKRTKILKGKGFVGEENNKVNFIFWLLVTLFFLVFYFIAPDSDGNAGFISLRLQFLSYLLLLLWFASFTFNKWFSGVVIVFFIVFNFRLVYYYTKGLKELNSIAVEVYKSSEKITPNSIVLPLNFSTNWLMPHFSNYLGIDKPMVILENYECSTGYFPVKWSEKAPGLLLGDNNINAYECVSWSGMNMPPKRIEYVFVLGNYKEGLSECPEILKEVGKSYTIVHQTDNVTLFKYNM